MKASEALIDKIKEFEGWRMESYQDSGGVWTIGAGHTRGVKEGQVITPAQAEALLNGDILPCERYVNALHLTLTQQQFDALVDFQFNTGKLGTSTLLQKIVSHAPVAEIQYQFSRWVHTNGKRLNGLVKRRMWEAEMWGPLTDETRAFFNLAKKEK